MATNDLQSFVVAGIVCNTGDCYLLNIISHAP